MKQLFFLCMASFALSISSPVFSADENKDMADPSEMAIEKIIASCEKQYTAEMYPDADERDKLVDQCIEENSSGAKE
jgi:hypothetical protein